MWDRLPLLVNRKVEYVIDESKKVDLMIYPMINVLVFKSPVATLAVKLYIGKGRLGDSSDG